MKDRRMDRFVVLPFTIGCASQSSVDVVENRPKSSHAEATTTPPTGHGERNTIGKTISSSFSALQVSKPSISAGVHKVVKGFKSLSQLFVVLYEDDEEDEDEERELQIGFPTDVQHVAHIGWDGFNSMNALPSFSLKQFELAMAAQPCVQLH